MPGGIHAQLSIGDPTACPLTAISEESTVTSVTRSTGDSDATDTTVEFTLEHDCDDSGATPPDDMTAVFEYEKETVYRFSRDSDEECPCDHVERNGCPIRDAHADRGRVMLSFISPDVATLQSIIGELKSNYDSVTVQQLAQTTPRNDSSSLFFFDKGKFTDRQYEVLQTAHELGYFAHPKRANAGDVADELGITTPTFVEHLSAAQSKLLKQLLNEC
ncbi:helix-turn-helix domain-containing protein [Haladaptatus sp. NG-SE-30]